MIKEKVRRPHQRVKGTVLFTVVCVMMVLVVFLMGTLALAATANKRANYKYMKAQNETIARTVIDAVVKDIKHDTSSDGINNALANNTSFDMEVMLDGRSYPVTVSRGGKQSWYDTNTAQWLEGDIINLTATVASVGGNEPVNYNASLVMSIQQNNNNNHVNPNPAGGAFVALGDTGGKIGTSGYVTGGTEVGINSFINKLEMDNGTLMAAPVYVNGNLETRSQIGPFWTSMQYDGTDKISAFVAVSGNLTFTDNKWNPADDYASDMDWSAATGTTSYYNIPCIFVGGKISQTNDQPIMIGSAKNATNLYCGTIDTSKNGGWAGIECYGDIYCFDENGTSILGGKNNLTKLYAWTQKTIKYEDGDRTQTFGNLYSRGNVCLGCREVNGTWTNDQDGVGFSDVGSIRCEKDIHLSCKDEKTIRGDLVAGNLLSFEVTQNSSKKLKVNGDIYAKTLRLNGWTVSCKNLYVDKIEGSGTITCSTAYQVGDKGGATVNGSDTTPADKKVKKFADIYPKGFKKDEIEQKILTIPKPTDYTDPSSFPKTEAELNGLNTIMTNGSLSVTEYDLGDANTPELIEDTNCKVSGSACRDYTFKPKGMMTVILDNVTLDGKHFIVDDTNGTVLFFVEGTFTMSAGGSGLWTSHYANQITKSGDDYVYKFTVEKTEQKDYPNVYIFGAVGSKMTLDGSPLITANIRAPEMVYEAKTAVQSNCEIKYIADTTITMNSIGVIGQCIAKNINVANNWALAYVEPGNNGGNNGGNNNNNNNGNNNNVNYSFNGASINYTIY